MSTNEHLCYLREVLSEEEWILSQTSNPYEIEQAESNIAATKLEIEELEDRLATEIAAEVPQFEPRPWGDA